MAGDVEIIIITIDITIITTVEEEEAGGVAVDTQMPDSSLGPMGEGLKYMPLIISLLKFGMRSHMLKEGGLMKKGNNIVKIKG